MFAHGKMYQRGHVGSILPSASELASGGKGIKNEKENMKKQETEVRNIFFKIRINESEQEMLKKLQQQSTEKSLSNYVRKVVLQKPVTIKYRNQSADEFLTEMLQLRKELNAIGNNFNQVVHKLHILDHIPEFRQWVKTYESLNRSVVQKVEDIRQCVIQLHEKWLRK